MSALSFQTVSKIYPAKQAGAAAFRALDQVSFEVEEGEFFGLLGPNGAGKTTLISILAGLARASQGQVLVHGHNVQSDYAAARRLLGVVPQELVFDPFFTVRESLRIQSGYFGVKKNDAWIDELLDSLGLTDKANANMRQLSGGMKRRVLVAQALVHKPRVIVLDEPTAGVDVELRQTLWQFIAKLNKQGHTVLLTPLPRRGRGFVRPNCHAQARPDGGARENIGVAQIRYQPGAALFESRFLDHRCAGVDLGAIHADLRSCARRPCQGV